MVPRVADGRQLWVAVFVVGFVAIASAGEVGRDVSRFEAGGVDGRPAGAWFEDPGLATHSQDLAQNAVGLALGAQAVGGLRQRRDMRDFLLAPAEPQASSARVSSASAVDGAPSDSINSMASASGPRPMWRAASTASMVRRSMSSSVTGTRPARVMRLTASPAWPTVGKNASIVTLGGGAGRKRSVASVMMPSVPSEPTKR